MEYRRFGQDIVVRLDRGEELVEAIEQVCQKENVKLAEVSGLGGCDYAELGFYDLAAQEYSTNTLEEALELIHLGGNITQMDGAYRHHLHASFGDSQGRAYGGHLLKTRIALTAEIFIRVIDGLVDRQHDEVLGIDLLQFKD